MEKDIKDYRNSELKSYVLGNILIILISSGLLENIYTLAKEALSWESILPILSSVVLSSVLYIYVFLADSIVPAEWKNKLIWMVKGKPGETIFTSIRKKNRDYRFSSEQADILYKKVYTSISNVDDKKKKEIENIAWYRIYKKHEEHPQVIISHRDFLLCRDMCIMTLLIEIGYVCLQIYLKQPISWKMILILVFEFVSCWIAAYNKSKTFAYNVIALDISKSEIQESDNNK